MSDITVYVDESGSTGLEVFDSAQAVYATTGVWLTPTNEEKLIDVVAEARRLYNVQMPELKGKLLIKSAPGRKAILHILSACIKAGVRYSMIAVEKPFMAAAVVIEDYTDSLYNPAFPSNWQLDASLKEDAAQRIYKALPRQTLKSWWQARNGGDKSAYEEAFKTLIGQLQLVPDCAELAKGFLAVDIDGLWKDMRNLEDPMGSNYSPNNTTFSALIQGFQKMAETVDYRNVSIVHDEQLQAESAITKTHKVLRDASHYEIDLKNGNKMRFPTDRLRKLEFRRSGQYLGLQIADSLAAVVRVCTEDCMNLNSSVVRQFRPLLHEAYQMDTGPSSIFVIGPLDWQPFAFRTLAGLS